MANIISKGPNGKREKKKLWLDAALPPLPLQHVWYEMKQHREWRSVALIPIADDTRTLGIAHSMGLMAVREPHDAVWVVNATGEAAANDTPDNLSDDDTLNPAFPYKYIDLNDLGVTREKQLFTAERLLAEFADEERRAISLRLIFAVDSIIHKTHAISLCRNVDAVILCVPLGRTSFKSIRRTIDIVGRTKILGSIVIHPKRPSRKRRTGENHG